MWLGTADEKAAHLLALTQIEQADLPHVTVGDGNSRTVRYFPDRLPIGIHLAGRGVVVYVVTDPGLDEYLWWRGAATADAPPRNWLVIGTRARLRVGWESGADTRLAR